MYSGNVVSKHLCGLMKICLKILRVLGDLAKAVLVQETNSSLNARNAGHAINSVYPGNITEAFYREVFMAERGSTYQLFTMQQVTAKFLV